MAEQQPTKPQKKEYEPAAVSEKAMNDNPDTRAWKSYKTDYQSQQGALFQKDGKYTVPRQGTPNPNIGAGIPTKDLKIPRLEKRNKQAKEREESVQKTVQKARRALTQAGIDMSQLPAAERRKADAIASKGLHSPSASLARAVSASELSDADIAKTVYNVLYWCNTVPCKTLEESCDRLNTFFRLCCTQGDLPTVEKAALCLGISTQRFMSISQRATPEGEIYARAKQIISTIDAELVSTGKIPPVPYIFRAKNFYGMRDETTVIIDNTAEQSVDIDELIAESELLPEDTGFN